MVGEISLLPDCLMGLEDARKIGYFVGQYVPPDKAKEATETLQYLFPRFSWKVIVSPPIVSVDLVI